MVGGSEDEAEHSQEVVATPSVQAQSSDRLTRQLVRRTSFRTSGSASRNRASGKSTLILIHDSDDEGASGERRSPFSLSPGSRQMPRLASDAGRQRVPCPVHLVLGLSLRETVLCLRPKVT